MPSTEKKERVGQIREWFEDADSLMVLKYRGLKVADANRFRREIKDNNAQLRVLKNTLTRLALAGTTREEVIPLIDGPIAVVFTNDELAPVARVIRDFSRGHDELSMMGGVFQGTMINALQAERLATLPQRDVLMAQVVRQVAAPLSGLVGVCAGPIRKLLTVMSAIAERKGNEPGEEPRPDDIAGVSSEHEQSEPDNESRLSGEESPGEQEEVTDEQQSEPDNESGLSGEESPGEQEEVTDEQER